MYQLSTHVHPEYRRSVDFEEIYLIGFFLCVLFSLLTILVYARDTANPSNWYFFVVMFTVFSLTSTYSAILAKDIYVDFSPQFYIVFVWFFNLLVVLFVILISLTEIWPSGVFSSFILKSGLGSNLQLVIFISIGIEFILDAFAYWAYADEGGINGHGWKWAWGFLLIELTLVVLAIIPSIEVFSFDAIMLAGVLSCAHILQGFVND